MKKKFIELDDVVKNITESWDSGYAGVSAEDVKNAIKWHMTSGEDSYQHLIDQVNPRLFNEVVNDIAEMHEGDSELSSSDVSIMVHYVLEKLGFVACNHCDGKGIHHVSADHDGAPANYDCNKCTGTGYMLKTQEQIDKLKHLAGLNERNNEAKRVREKKMFDVGDKVFNPAFEEDIECYACNGTGLVDDGNIDEGTLDRLAGQQITEPARIARIAESGFRQLSLYLDMLAKGEAGPEDAQKALELAKKFGKDMRQIKEKNL